MSLLGLAIGLTLGGGKRWEENRPAVEPPEPLARALVVPVTAD